MKSIGIDIGSYSIKVVEAVQSGRGVVVTRTLEKVLNENPAFDPELEILEFLRSFAEGLSSDSTKIVMGLPQRDLLVRLRRFPFTERLKILKSLPFELEEEIPFSLENALFDAKVVQNYPRRSEVLGIAAPRAKVEKIWKLARDGNFQLNVLSSEGVALGNLLENWLQGIPQSPAEPAEDFPVRTEMEVLLHIGHKHSVLVVASGGRTIGMRSILFGAHEIIQALSHKYEIPAVEAAHEFRQKAFLLLSKEGATYEQTFFSDTVAHALRPLVQELKLSLLEIEADLHGSVNEIWLSGGGAQIQNLHAFLTTQVSRVVNRFTFPADYQFTQGQGVEARFGVALGLAVEGLRKPRDPAVQFLQGEYAPQNKRLQEFLQTWGPSLKVAAAGFVIFWIFSSLRLSQSDELVTLSLDQLKKQARQTAGLSVKQANETSVRRYLKDQKKKSDEMKALSQILKTGTALDVLNQVHQILPSRDNLKLQVSHFRVQGESVEMKGTVQRPEDLTTLENGLKQLAKKGVEKRTPDAGAAQGVPFAYAFEVDRSQRTAR